MLSKLSRTQARAISFWRGGIAAATIFAVAYGLHVMGISDLWCLTAAIALNAAWTVGFGAANSAALVEPD